MARTWSLHDSASLGAGDDMINSGSFQYTQHPDNANIIYFISMGQSGSGTGNYVYSYNGTTVTELGFGTWLTSQGYIGPTGCRGICYFDARYR